MKCSKCGKNIPVNSHFCTYCGKHQTMETTH